MITLGMFFDKLADLDPEVVERVLNTPLSHKSLNVDIRGIELYINQYSNNDRSDALAITVDGQVEYLMCTEFLK